MPTYSSPFANTWQYSQNKNPFTSYGNPRTPQVNRQYAFPQHGGGLYPPSDDGGVTIGDPATGGASPPPLSPFPSTNYGAFTTPVTGFSPYVPSALQSDPATWRSRLSDNGQSAYNEAMRQLRIDQMRPPTEGTQEDYQNWQIQMQERANQIERDYEIAQKEYGQAWNEYVGAKAYNLIPYLGDQDRAYIENMVGAVVPGTQPVESTASDGTRADDRNLQLKDRWAAVRQGLEWGNSLFGNQTDPDPREQDRFEQSQQFLNEVANLGEQYGLRDTAHDFRRWQLNERAQAYNNLKSAYAPVLDERVVTLADTLFNPSQAGSAPSPMAQQLGGRYTRPNAGGNTGRQSANWAYRNSSLM